MADAATITRFRKVVGDTDTASELWTDSQLSDFIDDGVVEYTFGESTTWEAAGDDEKVQGFKLAHVTVLRELATDVMLFFKWKDQNKEVDKSMTPGNAGRLAKEIHAEVMAHRKAKKADTDTEERKRAQGGKMDLDPGSAQSDRTSARGWY